MKIAEIALGVPVYPFQRLFDYVVPDELIFKVLPGSLVEVPLGTKTLPGVVFALKAKSEFDPAKLKKISALKLEVPVFDRTRLSLLEWISRHYIYPIGEVVESALPASIRKGSAKTLKLPSVLEVGPDSIASKFTLNADQSAAAEKVLEKNSGVHVLWGVTGSGKTEVYLKIIEEKIKSGFGALILVPEIALTPQLTSRFEERFPGQVAVFHSAQKPTELRRAWLETLMGNKKIALGARSAVFAPVKNLGVVIVDEEHDSSYKQDDRLRYNARDCAEALAALYKIPLVVGSATPSSDTLADVFSGKNFLSKLENRAVGSARLPEIISVDLKKQLSEQNKDPRPRTTHFKAPEVRGDFFLTPELRTALDDCLSKEQQAILFLNRRGLGSQEFCQSCGSVATCPNCDVKLTPHFENLLCHYCGYQKNSQIKCSDCGAGNSPFVRLGIGTEAIEESIKLHYPKARVLRMDRDTTDEVGALQNILDQFKNKAADILIGTQMVAKGHDFPDVTLVGILLADLGLSVPDFRANERTLQLLLQVSGRAGRALHPGKVLLQSFQPEHKVFQTLLKYQKLSDYEEFIQGELEARKPLLYPPGGRLVLLKFDGLHSRNVEDAAYAVGAALKKIKNEDLKVLGPVESPISKIRNRYRFQILLKSSTASTLQKSVQWIFEGWMTQKLEKKYQSRMLIDVDPVNML